MAMITPISSTKVAFDADTTQTFKDFKVIQYY